MNKGLYYNCARSKELVEKRSAVVSACCAGTTVAKILHGTVTEENDDAGVKKREKCMNLKTADTVNDVYKRCNRQRK